MKVTFKRLRAIASILPVIAGLTVSPHRSSAFGAAPELEKWQVETVDKTGAGRFSSLKIDDLGDAHIAYVVQDGNQFPLRYAFWDHKLKRWFVMTVTQGAGTCSLALDSKRRPHISFADNGSGSGSKLRYAHWDGTSWKVQAIPLNSDIIAYYNSIALDPNDNPSISFYEYRGQKDSDFKIRLRHVIWNGQYWNVRTVDAEEGSGKFNAMVSDSQGHLHIGYANVSAGTAGMRYAFWDGKSWKLEILEGLAENDGGYVGYSACITVDKDGNPHVTYMSESKRVVKYAVRKDGKWLIDTVDSVIGIGYPDRNSIAVDNDGTPYVGYYDSGRGLLKLAHREGAKWVAEIVDGNGAGFTSSLQIANGNIWISYSDEFGNSLKVARREIGPSIATVTSANLKH
jgi:hypothetical protein